MSNMTEEEREMKYIIDQEEVTPRELIDRAVKIDASFAFGCVKTTSRAAKILRRAGHQVEEIAERQKLTEESVLSLYYMLKGRGLYGIAEDYASYARQAHGIDVIEIEKKLEQKGETE